MAIYEALVKALGHPYNSPELDAALRLLLKPSGLRKVGGYQAKVASRVSGTYLSFSWSRPLWILDSAILYAIPSARFRAFPEPFEGRVPPSSNRAAVRNELGPPAWSGGGGPPVMQVLIDYHWDRYDFEEYSVRFDYEAEAGTIRIASLMTRQLMLQLNRDRV